MYYTKGIIHYYRNFVYLQSSSLQCAYTNTGTSIISRRTEYGAYHPVDYKTYFYVCSGSIICISFVIMFERKQGNLKITQNTGTASKQVTKNVFIIYLCLVVFTLPQIVGLLFWKIDPDAYSKNYIVIRKKVCWEVLLIYSNSFTKAIAVLKSMRKH